MNSFVPKHKSYLKPRDLVYIKQKSKAEQNEALEKRLEKNEADIRYDLLTRE